MDINKIVEEALAETLKEKGMFNQSKEEVVLEGKQNILKEAYVVEASNFKLNTELLSDKNKKSHQELFDNYVKTLNKVSAKLDGCDKEGSNLNHSEFRNLKIDETYNHNAAFLHGLFFKNISDVNSQITSSSLTYMKLAQDFGTFNDWQTDFVACCLSSRNGWAVTAYNMQLKKYINTVIDLHSQNVMIGLYPVIVMDCWEHSYYRDYLKDRKTYVYGMMKELNWEVIEDRFKTAEKLKKIV